MLVFCLSNSVQFGSNKMSAKCFKRDNIPKIYGKGGALTIKQNMIK